MMRWVGVLVGVVACGELIYPSTPGAVLDTRASLKVSGKKVPLEFLSLIHI